MTRQISMKISGAGGGAGDGLIFGEGFLHYEFGGLTFGGVYFRNFTVLFFKVMSLK